MKLITYRVDQKKYYPKEKYMFFSGLRQHVLSKDRYWHFFLDPAGGTLRTSPRYLKQVLRFSKSFSKNINVKAIKGFYDPKEHEYYGVSFMGEDILPLFHEMSILSTHYPPYILMRPVLERLNHGLINMAGIHNFKIEAETYLDLAYNRVALAGTFLRLPRWINKWVIKHLWY